MTRIDRLFLALSFATFGLGSAWAPAWAVDQGAAPGAGPAAEAPASDLASAWSQLRGARDGIASEIAAGRLDQIHARSALLVPAAQAMLAASTDLSPEKRARLEAAVRQIPKIGEALHEAADAGSVDRSQRLLARLNAALALVRSQFPATGLAAAAEPGAPALPAPPPEHGPASHDPSAHAHRERPLAAVDAPPKATLQIVTIDLKFQPERVTIRAGEPTRFELRNEGKLEHALIVAAPDGQGDWIHLHAGADGSDAGTFQIDRPGKYPLLCTVPGHSEAGMVGELIVR